MQLNLSQINLIVFKYSDSVRFNPNYPVCPQMSELESDRESIISEASEGDKRTPAGKKAGRPTKAKAGEGVKSSRKSTGESAPGSRVQAKTYSAAEGKILNETVPACSREAVKKKKKKKKN